MFQGVALVTGGTDGVGKAIASATEFSRREGLKASLPGTVLRESRLLHAG